MPDQLPKFHTLDVWINGQGPFTAASQLRPGLGLTLFTAPDGFCHLAIRLELDPHTTKTYRIKTLKSGDRLKFTYDGPNDDAGSSIEEIEKLERNEPPPQFAEGHSLGLNILRKNGETDRLSRPPNGTLSLTLSNIPQDHARIWVYAGSEKGDWDCNLDDLYAGDSLEFEIVATDWCDEFARASEQQN